MRRLLVLSWLLVAVAGCDSHRHWHGGQRAHYHDNKHHEDRDAGRQVDRPRPRPTNAYEQIGADVAQRWARRWRTYR
jgi:hypothetical protein